MARLVAEADRALTDALAQLGVLTEDERERWNARFAGADAASMPLDGELHDRACAYLRRQLVDGASNVAGVTEKRTLFEERLQALLETGIVDWPAKGGWMRRLDEVLPPPVTPFPVVPYLARELRAVAIAPADRVAGLRVTAVELFDDCVRLRWHLVVDEDRGWRDRVHRFDHARDLAGAHQPRALEDNRGSAYTQDVARGGELDVHHLESVPAVLFGETAFTPHVPSDATTLTIRCPGGSIDIDVRDAARQASDATRPQTQDGAQHDRSALRT